MAIKRSPSAPTSTLPQAIDRARRLYQSNHDHWMAVEAVAEAWSLSPRSSSFLQAVATLLQYGLLLEKGSKELREFKLSDTALDIVSYPQESAEWLAAVQKAALSPPIHDELWTKFEKRLPPEDAMIRVYLLRQREAGTFRPEQVDEFIRQFRDTIAFAELSDSDTIKPADEPQSPQKDEPLFDFSALLGNQKRPPRTPPATQPPGKQQVVLGLPADTMKLPITLPSLRVAWLEVPTPLSEAEYMTLTAALASWKSALVQAEQPTSSDPPDDARK